MRIIALLIVVPNFVFGSQNEVIHRRTVNHVKSLWKNEFNSHEQIWLKKQADLFYPIIETAPGDVSIEDRLSIIDSFNEFLTHCMSELSSREIYRVATVLTKSRHNYMTTATPRKVFGVNPSILSGRVILKLDFVMTLLFWDLWDQVGINLFSFGKLISGEKQQDLYIILREVYNRRLYSPYAIGGTITGLLSVDIEELTTLSAAFEKISFTMNTFVETYGIAWYQLSFNPFNVIDQYNYGTIATVNREARMRDISKAEELVSMPITQTLAIIMNRVLHAEIPTGFSSYIQFSGGIRGITINSFSSTEILELHKHRIESKLREYCDKYNDYGDFCRDLIIPEIMDLINLDKVDFNRAFSLGN